MATTSTSPSALVVIAEPVFTSQERLALAGFLAGYTGLTRGAYALDLRQYATWCPAFSGPVAPTSSALPVIWKPKDRARATVTRRLCTIAGFYRYAVEEDLLDHSPAAHVRRPG
jgi:integrase/recombinase XerD